MRLAGVDPHGSVVPGGVLLFHPESPCHTRELAGEGAVGRHDIQAPDAGVDGAPSALFQPDAYRARRSTRPRD
ncbi:hypothetical protein GCM10010261_27900 [Streptomyces pilosus]|nr:hypothetical protein GCM10010261_27900 [Streptomyces pilosus]